MRLNYYILKIDLATSVFLYM